MGKKLLVSACLAFSLVVLGCGGGGTKVARVHEDSATDLSGRWNDTDSRLVADEMVMDALSRPWINTWTEQNKVPTVIVGRVQNRSHEHINVQTFSRNIERALLNSGKVSFVAGGAEREQIRAEREDQAGNVSMDTRAFSGEETGADLMMTGTINAIVDREGRRSVIFYQINMELIEMETNRKVWIGEKQIKKYVEQARTKL
ncbi:MAG: penicillin-binding protein activator LpoB [Chitinispirillales bacterium]|jgi:uncharacterized protein (TIGR02722 family)|nr:penicillin-binding protein activator LpoB [Chitinispirillales bacterium]